VSQIFHPLPHIIATVDAFYREKMDAAYVIGLQIRWGRGRDDIYFSDWEYDLNRFFECSLAVATNKHAKQVRSSVLFYISTDNDHVLTVAKQVLGNTRVIHQNIGERLYGVRAPDEDWEAPVIDNLILRKCDELVVTQGSTFGYLAHATADIIPYMIRRNPVFNLHHAEERN